jgi:hypothetical protein
LRSNGLSVGDGRRVSCAGHDRRRGRRLGISRVAARQQTDADPNPHNSHQDSDRYQNLRTHNVTE